MDSPQVRDDIAAIPGDDVTATLRDQVAGILRDEVRWEGPLPQGELDKHLDSLQRMSLVVAIEDHFRICFDPEDEATIHSLDDLLQTIARKLKAQP